jgi:hypothetical protein
LLLIYFLGLNNEIINSVKEYPIAKPHIKLIRRLLSILFFINKTPIAFTIGVYHVYHTKFGIIFFNSYTFRLRFASFSLFSLLNLMAIKFLRRLNIALPNIPLR